MNRLQKWGGDHSQLVKYAIIGSTGVAWDFICFTVLMHVLSWPYLLANAISVSLGITNNFFLNALYNFRTRDRLLWRFVRFYGIGLVGLMISSLTMFILVNLINLNALWAKLVTLFMVAVLQFYLNKTITFKNREMQNANG